MKLRKSLKLTVKANERGGGNDREREWKEKLEEGVQQSIRALRGGGDSNSRL